MDSERNKRLPGEPTGEVREMYRLARETRRARTMRQYGYVYDDVLDIIARHDPMNIVTINNPRGNEEYEPEMRLIFPRLSSAASATDVQQIIEDVFVIQFGAGYSQTWTDEAAEEIWQIWHKDRA